MATVAAIQAAIDSASTHNIANIQQSIKVDATYDAHYVVGISAPYQGRSKWCITTNAETAANQAAEIEAALILY